MALLALCGSLAATRAQNPAAFELLNGDRVALLGDTLIEREQSYGHLEFLLTVHYPDRNITFRNLGWSADTPLGVSRAGFDPPEKGFERLKEQLQAFKPTVVILGYGMASSFEGEAGLAKFTAEMNQLIDTIQPLAGDTKVRFILLSPIFHEALPPPLPDPAKHNEQLALYAKAIRDIAARRDAQFVPLFDLLRTRRGRPGPPLTDDGIHLTGYGYRAMAEATATAFHWLPNQWMLGFSQPTQLRRGSYGTQIVKADKQDDYVKMVSLENLLVSPPLSDKEKQWPPPNGDSRWQIGGLKPGHYELRMDGKAVQIVTDDDCKKGLYINRGPPFDQAEELRQAIVRKNELFFHRWRPQNNTYLYLFRKQEQGQNAQEIPRFDPLVEAEEQKIARLRKPVQHTYELVSTQSTNLIEQTAKKKTSLPAPAEFKALPLPQFDLDPGCEISLWAENPLLAKPIQINFDPQGRLWVASSSVYPQIAPGQVPDDKILVLEDTDGDGKADKSTVFADGLLIPTGVEPGDGGAYVGQSTELLHFKDTDGDGQADERRVVLSGFGTEDTHHIVHTLRWGYDGQLYFNQSIYIHSHLETPHGVVRLNSGGVFHLRPPTMELGIFLKGFCNPWGHHFDEFGQSFETDGAGFQGVSWAMPGATYFTYAAMRRELASVSPGSYPKFCGLEMVYSEQFPKEWQGNFITCDFRANRVVRFSIEEQGSAYVTKPMPDLLRTRDTSFRPVDVKLGPDGALYIADWSNPIIQHGEVDFRDSRRDHVHGRIWRLTAKGRPLLTKPNLIQAPNPALLDQLLSSNAYNREQAKRLLVERGRTNILADLSAWTSRQTTEKARLEALWMHQAADQVEPALLETLLDAKDGRVRAAATRVLGFWQSRMTNALDLLAKRVVDDFPRARVEAVRALANIPSARSAELALRALDKPMDKFIDYALWLTINDLARPWIAAIEAGQWKPEEHPRQWEFGVKAIEPSLASALIAKVLKTIPRDGAGGAIELIGQAGGADQLGQLFDQVLRRGFEEAAAARALAALGEAARLRNAKPSGDLTRVAKLLDQANEGIRAGAARLAGNWKLGSLTAALLKIAGDPKAGDDLRQAAFESLREIGGAETAAGLRKFTGEGNDAKTRRQAAVALAGIDLNGSLPQIVAVINGASKEQEALALWRSLLSVKNAPAVIAGALPKSGLPEVSARAGLRAAREGGHTEPELVLALARAGNLPDESQNLTEAELKKIAARVPNGDPARGENIYRRKELGCMVCHAIGGAGGRVGPDLTSIGASAPVDYLIESVLAPNKTVKEGYHSVQVSTRDGQELSGILARETDQELVLRDATNKEISVPKKDIESRKIAGSLMPAGLVDLLGENERLDLFRFLSELGKPGAFDATKGNVARLWRLNAATSAGEESVLQSDVSSWPPLYATVGGALLKEDLRGEMPTPIRREPIFAATRFQTAKAGTVKLKLDGVANPKAWIDGRPVGAAAEITADLAAGAHTFLVKLDPQQLPDQVRLELTEGWFLLE